MLLHCKNKNRWQKKKYNEYFFICQIHDENRDNSHANFPVFLCAIL